MRKFITKKLIVFSAVFLLLIITSVYLVAYPSGITGTTKRDSSTGCHCHTQNTAITGSITGPDTVDMGSTHLYTLTISRSGYSGAHGGTDIAVRLGSLDATPSGGLLRLQSGELTHNNPLTFTNGTTSVLFNYIASTSAGIDTIWSNVVAGYSNGWNFSPEKRVVIRTTTGIQKNQTVSEFKLNQNYPNPFNPKTIISFTLPKDENVTLKVYDILGHEVEKIIDEKLSGGNHEISWNGENFSSGIYFYSLNAENNVSTKRMILVK